jgi:vitamin B12 transporter
MSPFQRSALAAAIGTAVAATSITSLASETVRLAAVDYRPAMEYLVVTATRTDLDLRRTLAPVSVIERNDIERLQATSFIEAIQQTPGVDFSLAGGPGSASSLYLRGTNDKHTLFLLDGQRIGSATLGSTQFEQLLPEMIERIEIVRGPRASLYGSDTIGGVAQIFTRQPGSKPSAFIKAGAGDHNSSQLAVGGDTRLGALRGGLYLNHYDTQGIDNLTNDTPPNDDDDAYRNSSGLARLGYDFANGGAIDLARFESHSEGETDASFAPATNQPYNKHRIENSWLRLRTPVTEQWQTTLSLGRAVDDDDQFNERNPLNRSDFRTTRDSASWQNDLRLNDQHTLTLGVDYYEEKIDSSNNYTKPDGTPVTERDNTGYFAQYLFSGQRFDLQLGVREDDNSAYDSETTANVSVGFHLDPQHRLILSWGEAFKAPTFNDLYWPVSPWSYGNPNLLSESSENFEMEVRGDYETMRWSLAVFRNSVDNLIMWAPDPASLLGAYTPSNVANAEIDGFESSVVTELSGWLLSANFSYIDAVDADNDLRLVNRAQRLFNLDADRSFGRWDIGASWRVRDERYGNATNTRRLGGYGLLDLRAAFNIDDHWKLQLKLDNVFDKQYQIRSNYNTKGAGWFATVTYRM